MSMSYRLSPLHLLRKIKSELLYMRVQSIEVNPLIHSRTHENSSEICKCFLKKKKIFFSA